MRIGDLQNRVIIRKSHTEYPAAEGRPAFSHDDLMVVYRENGSGKYRAEYFDNEGHVIRYGADFSDDGRTLTLLSEVEAGHPVVRLTYTLTQPDGLGIKFEIAPPNAPKQFKVYVQGSARRT